MNFKLQKQICLLNIFYLSLFFQNRMKSIINKRGYNKNKIRKIIGTNNNVLEIIKFFDNIFDQIIIVENIHFTNYMIGNNIYFQDQKNGYLWVNYYKIWSILYNQYSLNTLQIKGLIQIMVEVPYGLGPLTPNKLAEYNQALVEVPYGLGSLTPEIGNY